MTSLPLGDSRVADCAVLVDGLPLVRMLGRARALIAASVHLDAGSPAMCALTLPNWDTTLMRYTWSEDRRLEPGGVLELKLGFGFTPPTVFKGEITALEPEFSPGQASTLTVRAYDLSHRLLRAQNTRAYQKQKDSQIAQTIATAHSLGCQAQDSKVVHEYVLQHNQTDLAFLQERAARIGYEVFVSGEVLHFGPPQRRPGPPIVLELGAALIEFAPRLSTAATSRSYQVRGWDPKRKQPIVGKAAGAGASPAINRPAPASHARGEYGSVTLPVASKAEADMIARAQHDARGLSYITGAGLCLGEPALRVGETVVIAGVGARFSGTYYLTSITHSYAPSEGYQTSFEVQRSLR